MPKRIENYAETTELGPLSGVIDDVLRSLRISGSLLLHESYAPPWAIAIPTADGLESLLGISPGVRPLAFHLVEFGHCELTPEGGEPLLLTAGELVICFGGQAHGLSKDRRQSNRS